MPIKKRITGRLQPMLIRTRMYAWTLARLYETGGFIMSSRNGEPLQETWSTIGVSVGNYDSDIEFIGDFHDKFFAHVYGPKGFETARRNLREILNSLAEDNWIDKFKSNCRKEYVGEPTWQMVYGLPSEYARAIKKGRETPEGMARRYRGDGYELYLEHRACTLTGSGPA